MDPKRIVRRVTWWLLASLAISAAVIPAWYFVNRPLPNRNMLAIGELAQAESLEVELQPLAELDFLSRSQLLQMRRQAVARYPQLMASGYQPDDVVFGGLEDGLPWWGIPGAYHYGRGPFSIEGESEQSLSVLNPFMLAVPELYLNWDETDLALFASLGQEAPQFCPPRSLQWYPSSSQVEAHYDAACLERSGVTFFSLIAYNARDLNLNYMYVPYHLSRNIGKDDPPTSPYRIPQLLHSGDSCGYPGGCNNISPQTPEIDNLQVSGWPAELVVWFWREDPGTLEESPDIVYRLLFD